MLRKMLKSVSDQSNKACLNAKFVLIYYPLLFIGIASLWITFKGFGLFELFSIIISYYICNISIGVGLHRYWSHDAFSLNKYVELILCLFSSATLQTPILIWASDHAKHHSFTDTEKDPHSSVKFGKGIKSFFWAHIGWMLNRTGNEFHKPTFVRLSKKRFVMWQMRYYGLIALTMNLLFPFMLGMVFFRSLSKAFSLVIFCGIGRIIQQQMTFCINSVTHFFGNKTYQNGSAGDITWLAIFLLGENYHNFHHAFPSDYRNGVKLHHLDVHKWIIFLLEKVGLAYNLVRTSEIRIANSENATERKKINDISNQWNYLKEEFKKKSQEVALYAKKTHDNAALKSNIKKKIIYYNEKLNSMYNEINSIVSNQEIHKMTQANCIKLIKNFENYMNRLNKNFSLYIASGRV